MTKTEEVIERMLKENTGAHFLDSGGAYGRHWERNQKRTFVNEPPSRFKIRGWKANDGKIYTEIECSINTYHFLVDRLSYDERLDAIWMKWQNRKSNKDTGYHSLVQEFPEWLAKMCPEIDMRCFSDRSRSSVIIYTYNEENFLDQDIYFSYWESGSEEYYLLGSHNGCDARGGFSTPHLFTGNGQSEQMIFDYGKFTIACKGRSKDQSILPGVKAEFADYHVWECDGYNFHNESYPKEGPDKLMDVNVYFAEGHDLFDPEIKKQDGDIVVDADEIPHCPVCEAVLEGYSWP